MTKPDTSTLFCSFCGHGDQDCDHLIEGPETAVPYKLDIAVNGAEGSGQIEVSAKISVCICNECVALCVQVLDENKKSGAATNSPAKTQDTH